MEKDNRKYRICFIDYMWYLSLIHIFTLDINNPNDPKILCVGNNPDRQNIYGAALDNSPDCS